jgi:hypothetical protein
MWCLLARAYAFLAGTWPFGIIEAIWAAVAARRYRQLGRTDVSAVRATEVTEC